MFSQMLDIFQKSDLGLRNTQNVRSGHRNTVDGRTTAKSWDGSKYHKNSQYQRVQFLPSTVSLVQGSPNSPNCLNHVTAMVELCSRDTAGLPRQNTRRFGGTFPTGFFNDRFPIFPLLMMAPWVGSFDLLTSLSYNVLYTDISDIPLAAGK